tara:strand:+ start:171 stop:521 length:351 start_codon:yes stop_codon:yes gene_type:complete
MPKKEINYSDLSRKELEILKDVYIDLKVKSMSINDLKDFATENISLQIKNTIGNDEELEAWQDMKDFFKDEFDNTIQDVQVKNKSKKGEIIDSNIKAIKSDNQGELEDKKLDMWED